MKQDVTRHLLVERLRAEAVGARQVEHDDRIVPARADEPPFFAFDGNAGIIAHPGPQAGQGVEQRRLAGVRISG
jgi:hypothetical protein